MLKILAKLENLTTQPRLLMVIFATYFLGGMLMVSIGTLLPFVKSEYNLDYVTGGLLISAHQVGNLTASFVSGYLPYMLGRKRTSVLMFSVLPVAMVLMTVTGTPWLLILAFACTGIARGAINNTSNVVVGEIAANKTVSLNILHAVFAVGAFVGPFLTVAYARIPGLGWRFTPWTIGLLMTFIMLLVYRSAISNETAQKKGESRSNRFFRSPRYWIIVGIMFFYICGESTIVGWLVTYFKDSGIMSGGLAQITASVLWIMVLAGRLLCAAFASRVQKTRLIIAMAAFMTAFYALMISTQNVRIIFPALMGLGLSMAGLYPTVISCMEPEYSTSSAALGTCIALATLGGILMPSVVGAVAQRTSIAGGMAAITAAQLIMLTLTVVNHFALKKAAE